MKLWTWDLETVDWDQPVCAVAVSEEGDVVRFYGPACLERMCDHMLAAKGCFVAHYGGGFDVPLMLNVHKFRRIILSGSNILCAEENRDLKLRDSYPWFLASLAKIGKAVGLDKSDAVDRGNLAAHTQSEILDYCERDCMVLLRGVQVAQKFLDDRGAQRTWTAGSSAINLLRALEPGTYHAMQGHTIHVDTLRLGLQAVCGGRVECTVRGYVPTVYPYDFKSSYPARYATQPLGIGMRPATRADHIGVWRCRWTWPHRFRLPPALDSRTLAGLGPCEAWLIDEEIACFESVGVKVQRFEGWAPTLVLPIGHTFLREMFAAKEGGGPASFCAKVWGNSAHGKFCEDPMKEAFTSWRPAEYVESEGLAVEGSWFRYCEMKVDKRGHCAPHAQPLAGALVLGRARAALWRAMRAIEDAGFEVYYCDTDSIFTNCPPDKMPIPLGAKLGDLASEGGPYEGWFLGPKAYLLRKNGKVEKSALKGVPLRSYENGFRDGDKIREARRARPGRAAEPTEDLRLEVFKRALAGGARCEKDGVTSFLRGLSGVSDVLGKKDPEHWKRAPTVRVIKPSGRGKAFGATSRSWGYLTTLEIGALDACRRLPMSLALWDRVHARIRAFLVREQYAAIEEPRRKRFWLTPKGAEWVKTLDKANDDEWQRAIDEDWYDVPD